MRVRRGVVQLPPSATPAAYAFDRDSAAAALTGLGSDTRLSHGTAGQLWTLPRPRPGRPDTDVWATSPHRHGVVQRGVHLRIGSLDPADCDVVDGLRCTSLARTAVDMARFRPLPESLVVLDAVLQRVQRAELWAAFDRHPMVYGRAGLREAITEADARAESPLESASRGLMLVAKLPRPALQRTVWLEGAAYRLDFVWDGPKVVGEADGWGKLQSVEDLRAEKIREDALRRAGFTVVRWTSDDVWRAPNRLVSRLRPLLTP